VPSLVSGNAVCRLCRRPRERVCEEIAERGHSWWEVLRLGVQERQRPAGLVDARQNTDELSGPDIGLGEKGRQKPEAAARSQGFSDEQEVVTDEARTFRWKYDLPRQSIPPTGKAFRLGMATIGHWKGGTMDHEWLFWDSQDFMKQLGLAK
jgi:hypothetical protein